MEAVKGLIGGIFGRKEVKQLSVEEQRLAGINGFTIGDTVRVTRNTGDPQNPERVEDGWMFQDANHVTGTVQVMRNVDGKVQIKVLPFSKFADLNVDRGGYALQQADSWEILEGMLPYVRMSDAGGNRIDSKVVMELIAAAKKNDLPYSRVPHARNLHLVVKKLQEADKKFSRR